MKQPYLVARYCMTKFYSTLTLKKKYFFLEKEIFFSFFMNILCKGFFKEISIMLKNMLQVFIFFVI